jgi:dihydroorotate dehydrogenase (NAD+) catalytic subunit
MVDLGVQLGGLNLKNPIIAASGSFGFGEEYGELYDISRLGAVCTKGLTLMPREGNPPPRLWETPCGLLNSIGLQNPGIEHFIVEELPRMKRAGTVVIANVWGETVGEYATAVERLSATCVDAVELNLSCPNVSGGEILGRSARRAREVIRETRGICEKPLFAKLPPEGELLAVAQACQAEGADAISAVNTFRAMKIDIETGKPVFKNIFAGLSGPGINPIALRMTYELSQSLAIPVIGIGGITGWQDAVEFIIAGAHAVQLGTANFIDPWAGLRIIEGLELFMKKRSIESLEGIRGLTQR